MLDKQLSATSSPKHKTQPERPKQLYAKPVLRRVTLRPEEAVLGNCKSSGGSGPGSGNCAVPGCSSVGS